MKNIFRIVWVRKSAVNLTIVLACIVIMNTMAVLDNWSDSKSRTQNSSDTVPIRVEYFGAADSHTCGSFNQSTGQILINKRYMDALTILPDYQLQRVCHHELRHAKHSEYGNIPLNMGEISATLAEILNIVSDSTSLSHLTHQGFESETVSYNVKYYIPHQLIDASGIDNLVTIALNNWNKNKNMYAMSRLVRILLFIDNASSPFEKDFANDLTREQVIDSVMTFTINDRPINLYRALTPEKQKVFKKLCRENPISMWISAGKKLH